ncbi:MAG: IclR family transcriptional regulator [Gemmobacter sp.]|jgi:DNA-binding IclR family transcriptional regulator|nr:IclR family transcriptional regulator [Gemmobacter sp.]
MGTVAKALELLDLFSRARPALGLSEAARLAGLNKATCHRLLGELQARGFVEQAGAAREYRLGPAVLRLAALREAAVPLRAMAQPMLERLADETGETAHLSALEAGRLRMLAWAYPAEHVTRVMMADTDTLLFHATSSGLAVLAYLPEAARAAVLAEPLPRLTERTESDPDAVRARLVEVRSQGHAESAGSFEAEVHSLAVPLFDTEGAVTGALAVAAPVMRMTGALRGRIRDRLIAAAMELNDQGGGAVPPDLAALWRGAMKG